MQTGALIYCASQGKRQDTGVFECGTAAWGMPGTSRLVLWWTPAHEHISGSGRGTCRTRVLSEALLRCRGCALRCVRVPMNVLCFATPEPSAHILAGTRPIASLWLPMTEKEHSCPGHLSRQVSRELPLRGRRTNCCRMAFAQAGRWGGGCPHNG